MLAAVESELADIVHPAVRNHHYLDSAATVFDLRAQIANAMGDAYVAQAASKAASDVRARIEALASARKS